jgi:putative ABC transport system ATP-binding protein
MISLKGITRTFEVGGRPVLALRGIDLEVAAGDYLSVMGPSGSGKTTLLSILGCLDRPTAGSYRLDGREVSGLSDEELSLVRRHKIGFVFQTFHLVPRLTAQENVELPMIFAEVPHRERIERARSGLAAVGLSERAHHRPEQLSGGERQRVAIARAIVRRPAILMLDEATSALDSESERLVQQAIDRVIRDATSVVIAHRLSTVLHADQIVVLNDKRVEAIGRHAELLERSETYARLYRLQFTEAVTSERPVAGVTRMTEAT